MSDKYQKAIEYLTEHPEEIEAAWCKPLLHPAGCLFQYVTKSGGREIHPSGKACGCLTMVKSETFPACTEGLTAAIRADNRIPSIMEDVMEDVKPEHLPVFAEWQARIDRELGRGKATL